jgi:hypothetical protein
VEIHDAISFAFSEDAKTIFVHEPKDGIREHRLSDGSLEGRYEGEWPHAPEVYLSALAPGGRYLATADSAGTVSIWNVATGKLDHQITPADCGSLERLVHDSWYFTPNARHLVIRWFTSPGIE